MTSPESVVDLADRPVPQRKASIVYAVLLSLVAIAAYPTVDALYATLDSPSPAIGPLRRLADSPVAPKPPARSAIVLLIDGLREDEARRLPSLGALADEGVSGVVQLEPPTLSTPYYHALLTGVTPAASGVRSNRFHGPARFDTIADRFRAAGAPVTWISEEIDWLPRLDRAAGDVVHARTDALGAPLDRALEDLVAAPRPALVFVHVVAVDESAHDHGVEHPTHRRALEIAGGVTARVSTAARRAGALLVVVSDHGHVTAGGHGGAEPEVARAPFVVRAPGLAPGRAERALNVAEIAPAIAALAGVAPPRSAIAPPPNELAPGPHRIDRAFARSRAAASALAGVQAELGGRRTVALTLWAMLAIAALGATKRAFRGFDLGTLIAPALMAAIVLSVHVGILGRPLSLSAIDERDVHVARLVALGAAGSAIAIPLAALVARCVGGGGAWRRRLRRAAAANGLVATALAGLAIASTGASLGPWALDALALYAPVLAAATMAGAHVVSASVLIASAIKAATSGRRPTSAAARS